MNRFPEGLLHPGPASYPGLYFLGPSPCALNSGSGHTNCGTALSERWVKVQGNSLNPAGFVSSRIAERSFILLARLGYTHQVTPFRPARPRSYFLRYLG